ncbi:HipA domain-containing protein [Helicobacter bizzozeronii]|uniref:HipA domain-containing protein n=1 Tax=Helicobacter bizzozeronii TaxID=56877 RepID=UPI000CEF0520|nr:HipA domain-containing protein [Helicobacter bizzozeronii]
MAKIEVFQKNKIYGYIDAQDFYRVLDNGKYVLDNESWSVFKDLLPEGIDLELMRKMCKTSNDKEILSFLKNPIGDFSFYKPQSPIFISDPINPNREFPHILFCQINIDIEQLCPKETTTIKQQLSLSGVQHKLQACFKDNILSDKYSNLILKPLSLTIGPSLAVNEHLHTTFMKEFGLESPPNALVYDERLKAHHYIIERFDVTPQGDKINQISLNSLMGLDPYQKDEGSIERCAKFLNPILETNQKELFVLYVYANVLLYNGDLHKKNISFLNKKGAWKLSPAYDVNNLNLLPSRFVRQQSSLNIEGKRNKLSIKNFRGVISSIGLDFDSMSSKMEIFYNIYKEKYPLYIEKVDSPKLRQKLFETYDRNIRFQENKSVNTLQSIKQQKPRYSLAPSPIKKL